MSRNDLTDCPTDEEIIDLADKVKTAAYTAMERQLGKIDSQYHNYLDQVDAMREEVAWIPERFKSFLTLKPENFQVRLDAIDDVGRMLGTGTEGTEFTDGKVRGKIDDAKGLMEEWEGALSDAFISNFLTPMSSHIVSNQGISMLILRDNLMAMRNIYVETRKSLKTTGENAITAFEAADGISAATVKTILTVTGAAFGLGAAALLGPAAPIVGAIVAGSVAIGTNEIDEEDKQIPLGADFPDQVIENLRGALDEIEKSVRDKENELIKLINEAITSTAVYVSGFYGLLTGERVLLPPVPKLVSNAVHDPDSLTEGIVQNA